MSSQPASAETRSSAPNESNLHGATPPEPTSGDSPQDGQSAPATDERTSRLTLLRHGRAKPPAPGLEDFDRPLVDSGRLDIRGTLSMEAVQADLPERILCSTGRRALETAHVALEFLGLDKADLEEDARLYLASADTLLSIIAEQDEQGIGHLMIVGHNPGLEILASELDVRAMSGLPTAGLYRFARRLDKDNPGLATARLLFETRPPRRAKPS